MDKCECNCHDVDEGFCENCLTGACSEVPKKFTKEQYDQDLETERLANSTEKIDLRRQSVLDWTSKYGTTLAIKELLAKLHDVTVQTIERDIRWIESLEGDYFRKQRLYKFGYHLIRHEQLLEGLFNDIGLRLLKEKENMSMKDQIDGAKALVEISRELRDNSARGALEDITKVNINIEKMKQKYGDL